MSLSLYLRRKPLVRTMAGKMSFGRTAELSRTRVIAFSLSTPESSRFHDGNVALDRQIRGRVMRSNAQPRFHPVRRPPHSARWFTFGLLLRSTPLSTKQLLRSLTPASLKALNRSLKSEFIRPTRPPGMHIHDHLPRRFHDRRRPQPLPVLDVERPVHLPQSPVPFHDKLLARRRLWLGLHFHSLPPRFQARGAASTHMSVTDRMGCDGRRQRSFHDGGHHHQSSPNTARQGS